MPRESIQIFSSELVSIYQNRYEFSSFHQSENLYKYHKRFKINTFFATAAGSAAAAAPPPAEGADTATAAPPTAPEFKTRSSTFLL